MPIFNSLPITASTQGGIARTSFPWRSLRRPTICTSTARSVIA
jgi:hypothetical protein